MVRDYEYWKANGKPYRLARPPAALQDTLQGYGYTVYDYPNEAHLEADPAEDHTPFSETGWPGESPYGIGFAIDIMPSANPALPTIAELAAQILHDKEIGHLGLRWLKYMNSTEVDGDCWNDSWKPNHARRTSRDRGHIHLSGRTDFASSPVGDDYDPVARFRARKAGKSMFLIQHRQISGQPTEKVYITDGLNGYRWVKTYDDLKELQAVGVVTTEIHIVKNFAAFGPNLDELPTFLLAPTQITEIAEKTSAMIVVPPAVVEVTAESIVEAFEQITVSTSTVLKLAE